MPEPRQVTPDWKPQTEGGMGRPKARGRSRAREGIIERLFGVYSTPTSTTSGSAALPDPDPRAA